MAASGYIDKLSFCPAAGGWLFCGWIPVAPALARGLPLLAPSADVVANTTATGLAAQIGLFDRADLGETGTGLILLIRSGAALADGLKQVRLRFGRNTFPVEAVAASAHLPEGEMVMLCRSLVANCFGGHRDELTKALRSDGFRGVDTLDTLREFVRASVDEMIVCQPGGVVLMGWMLSAPGAVQSIAICTSHTLVEVAPATMLRTERPDVRDTVGRPLGLEDSKCGFVAFVEATLPYYEPAWLRIETRDGGTGYTPVPPRRLRGMAAIRRVLDVVDMESDDLRLCYDTVAGPACARLNHERLAVRPRTTVARFGTPAAAPRFSLVIPLYGRIDYLEYQIAAFSFAADFSDWQVIYVLDDPPRRAELLQLAESVHARFDVPFELLLLEENLGFAPANNCGLAAARGEFVCYLNSDVIPHAPDFLQRLAADLEENADVGVVGGLLLFEDGSVQHEGMVMKQLPSKGGLPFPMHPRKGWRPREGVGLERCEMVTGACMFMRRALAERLGGFDEGFIIGDFEDADLCVRLRATGAVSAVDHRVQFYHLERQSQGRMSARWRNNLTSYNACLYDQRRREAGQQAALG